MSVKDLLRDHTSVRKYTGEEIPRETVIDLIQTAQMVLLLILYRLTA